MKMPVMISNRTMITCWYEAQGDDGWKKKFHSSKGNEQITADAAAAIGKDVVGTIHVAYYAWKPYEGGMEIKFVNKVDPNGSIPDMIKNKMAKRMSNGVMHLVNFLKTGAKPGDD